MYVYIMLEDEFSIEVHYICRWLFLKVLMDEVTSENKVNLHLKKTGILVICQDLRIITSE